MKHNYLTNRQPRSRFPFSLWFTATMLMAFCTPSHAQVANYAFSQSSTTYTALSTSSNISVAAWDDNGPYTAALPFTFQYNGIGYNAVSVNCNGFITFGATASNNNEYNPISSGTGYAGAVSALGRDLVNNGSRIVGGTIGTAPNRIAVIQWTNARRYAGASRAADFDFQIRLFESSNIVQIVYGSCTSTYTTDLFVQVGLRGATNADFNNRTTATNWAATTAGGANTATCVTGNAAGRVPASGLTFTWTPRPYLTSITGAGCVGNTVTIDGYNFLNATNVSFNGVSAAFTVVSANQITATIPVGATSGNVTVTTPPGTGTSPSSFTVNSYPTVAPISGSNTVCQGGTTTLSSATSGGTWSSNNNTVATVNASGVVSGLVAGSAVITYQLSNGSCTTTRTFNITVNAAPSLSGPSSVCIGNTIQLLPSSGGTWVSNNPAQASISPTGLVTGLTAGNATFTFTNSTTSCSATTGNIAVQQAPSITGQSGSLSVCSGTSASFSVSASGTTPTYQWFRGATPLSNGGNLSGATTSTLTISPVALGDAATDYYCVVSGPCAPSATSNQVTLAVTEAVTITAQPAATQTVCSGNTVNFTVLATGAGLTYQWYNGASTINNGPNVSGATSPTLTLSNVSVADASTIYHCIVTGTSPCTPKTSLDAALVVNQGPAITLDPVSQTVCAGDSVSFSVNANGGGLVYQWYNGGTALTNAGSISGATTATLTINPTVPGDSSSDYHCVVSNGCVVPAQSASAVLTVNERPFLFNYTTSVCSESTFTLIPANGVPSAATIVPAGTTYSWSAPTVTGGMTGGTAQSGLPAITGTLFNPTNTVQTATYTVTPTAGTAGNCVGAAFTVTVTVNPLPALNNLSGNICSGQTLTITPTNGGGNIVPAGTTYSWSAPTVTGGMTGGTSGSGQTAFSANLTNPTNTIQSASYNVTASAGGCTGSVFTIDVNVYPQPTVVADIAAQTICSDDNIAAITLSNPNNLSGTIDYSWTRNNTGNVTGMLASGNGQVISGTLTNTSNTPQTTVFTVTATSDQSCASTPITVSVTVNPAPTVAATPATQTVCSGSNITAIAITNPNNVSGTTYSWTRDNTVNLTGIAASGTSANISGAFTNNTLTVQTTTFTITASAAGCGTATTTVTVSVNPRPDVAATPATQTVCAGTPISTITLSNPNAIPGTVLSWTRNNTANTPGIAGSGSTATINGTLNNLTGVDQTTTFTVTATRLGCASAPVTVDVIVMPAPLAVATPATQGVCTGSLGSILFSTSNTLLGTTFSWTRDNTGNVTGVPASGTGDVIGTFTNATAVNQTTTFTVLATAPNGCTRTITASVTVYPVLTTPTIEDSQVVCQGSRPTTFVMTTPVTGGSGTYTYQWQSSTVSASGPWTNVGGATTATYQPPTTTGTTPNTWYQVVVSSCGSSVTSNSVLVVVGSNNNFTITLTGGGNTVCPGTIFDPGIATLHGGSVYFRYNWIADPAYIAPPSGGPVGATAPFIFGTYYSTADFTLTTINNTNANVTTTVSVTPILYDADTNMPVCSLSPRLFTVTIRPKPTATATVANSLICSGTSAGISVTSNVTSSSAVTYAWSRSANANVTSSQATGSGTAAQGNAFTIPDVLTNNSASNQNVTYTITPTSAAGCAGTPTTITITVAPQLTPGSVGTNHSVCWGGDPNPFVELTAALGSGLSFQWQSSTTSSTGPWSDIAGATAATYDAPAPLTQTTWYIRVVTSSVSGITCSVANSAAIQVTVNNVTPGSVNGTQTICSGGDPTVLGSAAAGTGNGTVTYQWQSNTTGCGGSYTNIGGATAATYDPPAGLLVTTYYRRVTTSTIGANACVDYSNCITVSVNNITAGTVGSDQTLCGNDPAPFSVTTAATASGIITYQWQNSTVSCGSGWANISGATGAVYDAPAGVSVITYYRRIAYSTLNGVTCQAISNCITVTPNGATPGVIAANRTVCMGGDPSAFTETTPATGTGLTYQWQIATASSSGPWTDIPSATGVTYDAPGPINAITYFRRIAMATVNSTTCTAASNVLTVFVNDVNASTIAGDQMLCSNLDPVAFTVTTAASGNGTISYQWQRSTVNCSTGFVNIVGATSATYDAPAVSQTTYFHVVVTSTLNSVACTAISNCVTVTVNARVWAGTVNTDWNNAANWIPAVVPNASNCVVIPNTTNKPQVLGASFDAYAYSVSVQNGAILEIMPGNSLTVTDQVNVSAGGTFHVRDDANLVQVNNVANIGNINMQRITQPMYRYDYTYWGSPVTLASAYTLGMLSPNTLSDKYFYWNPTVSGGAGNWVLASAATVMNPNRGYIVRAPQTFSMNPATTVPYVANFVGVPNNGDIQIPIAIGAMAPGLFNDKLNLLGNPYPSAVDADLFLNDPTNAGLIDGTIYFWTHHSPPNAAYANPFYGNYTYNYTAGDYATYTPAMGGVGTVPSGYGGPVPNGYIAAGQGFFVKGLASGTAHFTNTMRDKDNNADFFKMASPERQRIWLNLANAQGGFSQLMVGYADGATAGYDRGFDATGFAGNFVSFYSLLEADRLTIQARALPFVDTDTFALGFNATAANTYTIGIDHFDGAFQNQAIYLEDRLLGIIHNLKTMPYTFLSEAGNFTDRFVLRFTDVTLTTAHFDKGAGIVGFVYDGWLKVQAPGVIDKIIVYDITGKVVERITADGAKVEREFRHSEGFYTAKVWLKDDSVHELKLIHNK